MSLPSCNYYVQKVENPYFLQGLSDVNKTRTRMTEQYIRKCHYILLVAPIGRVQTDNLVHKRLLEYSRAKAGRKALICTRIDVRN